MLFGFIKYTQKKRPNGIKYHNKCKFIHKENKNGK